MKQAGSCSPALYDQTEALEIVSAARQGKPHRPIETRHAVALVEMLAERKKSEHSRLSQL
jgi:hypothetical protein